MRVVVTVPPLAGLVKPLLPPGASITVLMAPGKSEHGYEFTPGDLALLGGADVVVYIGLGLEPSVEAFLKKNPSSHRHVVCFADAAGIKGDDHGHDHAHDHDHDHSHAVDPHLWLDPVLCEKLVDSAAAAIRTAGSKTSTGQWGLDIAVADVKSQLTNLDGEIKTRLAPLKNRAIVTHHNAWQRLADRYTLTVAAVIREFDGEPTPGAIAAAVEAIGKQNATAVFVEPQFDPQAAQRIAEAAGVKLGVLDPLGNGDYFAMMRANVESLVHALGN